VPRRNLFTTNERKSLLAFPTTHDELIRHYTFSQADLSVIRRHRGEHNRLGFAIALCALRHPGITLGNEAEPPAEMLEFVARQIPVDATLWSQYARRTETRREHILYLQNWLGLTPFSTTHYRSLVRFLTDFAQQTDRSMTLVGVLLEEMHRQKIVIPAVEVIERLCAEALTQGTRKVHQALVTPLSEGQKIQMDGFLGVPDGSVLSMLAWLRQSPGAPNAKQIVVHLERLRTIEKLGFPEGISSQVHQNRLLKMAREGGQMTAQHLRELEPTRRQATLVALLLETRATLIDEIIDQHDRLLGTLFSRAKNQQAEQFQETGRALGSSLRLYSQIFQALIEAKQESKDAFAAIESIIPWDAFTDLASEAKKLVQPSDRRSTNASLTDYLPLLGEGYAQLRRYTPTLLETLKLKAAPAAQDILDGVNLLQRMNEQNLRKVPEDAPKKFIRKRWESVVREGEGYDRRFYEICVFSEMKNALRSGDIWVQGSRQFRDFEEYLLPPDAFATQRTKGELGLAVDSTYSTFIESRMTALQAKMKEVEQQALANTLPDASITKGKLKITPLANMVPEAADTLKRQAYALMPHIKITELLLEVDSWTGFTKHFTHLKTESTVSDSPLLLTAILADGINLGLSKMAESCPGTTYAKLSWLQAWHIRDETYSAALAELVNAQQQLSFAKEWGEGTTSSSDGQWFHAGGTGQTSGHLNARYGKEPGVTFYTHISDQYAPFHTRVINASLRDATYVLDGLLYHESDLRIEEHYTDTAGFTDHVFGLMHLLGFRFAPRIRDLTDKNLYLFDDPKSYPTLTPLIGGAIQVKHIQVHWDEILRLATSIRQGTVTASLMLRKLGSYPRQNGLAVALRELGRIERTLFTLDWIQNVELRRRVQVGLNKGEARNALARAVFFCRLGELRDRSFENQRYRASGLNLVVAAIALWNTVYLERAVQKLKSQGYPVDDTLLGHISPLAWEHINLTGDYVWRQSKRVEKGKFRALRPYKGI
jgi:TnpA family transposase